MAEPFQSSKDYGRAFITYLSKAQAGLWAHVYKLLFKNKNLSFYDNPKRVTGGYQPKVTTLDFVLAQVVTSKLTPFPCCLCHYENKATVS